MVVDFRELFSIPVGYVQKHASTSVSDSVSCHPFSNNSRKHSGDFI